MEASSSIPMPQAQGTGANEPADNPELMLCQFRCFGRSVSLTKGSVVFLSVVGMSACLSVGLTVAYAVYNNTAIGSAAAGAASFAAGVAAAVAADRLYVKYRHVIPTFSPAE